MTWFERIRTCGTPEEMAALLDNGRGRVFCPHVGDPCPCRGENLSCCECVARWLKEAALCQNGN